MRTEISKVVPSPKPPFVRPCVLCEARVLCWEPPIHRSRMGCVFFVLFFGFGCALRFPRERAVFARGWRRTHTPPPHPYSPCHPPPSAIFSRALARLFSKTGAFGTPRRLGPCVRAPNNVAVGCSPWRGVHTPTRVPDVHPAHNGGGFGAGRPLPAPKQPRFRPFFLRGVGPQIMRGANGARAHTVTHGHA